MTDKTSNDELTTEELVRKAAADVLDYAMSSLIVRLRFLDAAMGRLELVPSDHIRLATDGRRIFYEPGYILRLFRDEHERPARDYLHMLLHCIFSHMFTGDLPEPELWDLACDIAAESTINNLRCSVTDSARVSEQNYEAGRLRSEAGMLTAEKLYHYFLESSISSEERERLGVLFRADDHSGWHMAKRQDKDDSSGPDDEKSGTERNSGEDILPMPVAADAADEWRDIAEKTEDALRTLFRDQGDAAGDMMQNLKEVTHERYDYAEFLKKFAVFGETVSVNDEEFDYIFYTYGLELYGNMPLVEPLEYKEVKRIRDFVIAIDTSGSTSGELVQKFLQKTYNILKSRENYFSHVNIHIIQCDAEVREHVKVTSEDDFDHYMSSMKILGLGGTDFRPVFDLTDSLLNAGEFTDLKGLIYFTDGRGIYPARRPGYETAFVFLDDEYDEPGVPPWAIRLVLQSGDI